MFLTGSAGVGKSETTRAIVAGLEAQGRRVAKTSQSAIAATHIDGRSIMSLFRLIPQMLRARNPDATVGHVMGTRQGPNNLRGIDTLIIDEISLLDGEDLDRYDYVARNVREDERPFGGMQVILVGDFSQLPPVKMKKWAFNSDCWAAMRLSMHELTIVHRQDNPEDVELLQRMRKDRLTFEDRHALSHHTVPHDPHRSFLFPCCEDAERENLDRLDRLPGLVHDIFARDDPGDARMYKGCMADKLLQLKEGAEVICIKNVGPDDEVPIVNGSRGFVVRFETGQVGRPLCTSVRRRQARMQETALTPLPCLQLRGETPQLNADGSIAENQLPVVEFRYRGKTREYVFDKLAEFDCSTPAQTAKRKQIPLKLACAVAHSRALSARVPASRAVTRAHPSLAGGRSPCTSRRG